MPAAWNSKQTLPKNHIYHKYPRRFIRYDGKLYFDPGQPENRAFIGKVVDDIVSRYDIDGIHFDDYFYPYPVAGKRFADDSSFAKYGKGMTIGDWRRHNVDLLIEDIHNRIKARKPWVRFGVSPFGIWRNKKTDPRGSDTSGLQNYDALYADVLLWEEKGLVEPQRRKESPSFHRTGCKPHNGRKRSRKEDCNGTQCTQYHWKLLVARLFAHTE